MNIPRKAYDLITRLEETGFEAYVVGGCVRDSLAGLTPKDWDICTSASPEQVEAVLFKSKVIKTGIKHGTVTVINEGEHFEITTFRLDGEYRDSRHPESVSFTRDIILDLARRDFTVNAMAYSPFRGLVDPFNGAKDYENGVLRAVGDPGRRFQEDALRILRGLRFSVTCPLRVEQKTAAAMVENRALLDNVSPERKRDELLKTLTGGRIFDAFDRFRDIVAQVIPQLETCFDFEQQTKHHCFDVYRHILTAVDNCRLNTPNVKMAMLLHDVAKPACCRFYDGSRHFKGHQAAGMKMAGDIVRRLKFDRASEREIKTLVQFHDVRLTGGMPQILKIMNRVGEDIAGKLFAVMRADVLAQSDFMREEKLLLVEEGQQNFMTAVSRNMCFTLKQLDIDGSTVEKLGLCGREIKAALGWALNGVMNEKVENKRENLVEYILRWKTGIDKAMVNTK